MSDLKVKVVVVTEASKGIGAAIAKPMRALARASGRHTLDRRGKVKNALPKSRPGHLSACYSPGRGLFARFRLAHSGWPLAAKDQNSTICSQTTLCSAALVRPTG